MKLKLALAGVIVALGLGGFAALTLETSYYPVIEGDFSAEVAETRGSVTIQASQTWRVSLEDGRQWWVGVPTAAIASEGDRVRIRVACKTENYENCTATYLGKIL